MKTIDELIGELPENFPDAVEMIKNEVVPKIADCDRRY